MTAQTNSQTFESNKINEDRNIIGSNSVVGSGHQVHGNQNIIGDYNTLNTFEYSIVEKTNFFEPDLTQFSPPSYLSPPFTQTIVVQLLKQRLVIIGGSPSIDKGEIARHIAWYLRQHHLVTTTSEKPYPVQEQSEGSDSQGLDISLREAVESSVFILPKLSPEQFGYEPSRYRNIAQKNDHYIIASSDVAVDVWKMPPEQQSLFWFDVAPDRYTDEYLTAVLRSKLQDSNSRLPKNLTNRDWENRLDLVEGIQLIEIASQLKIPSNIDVFVDFICNEAEPDLESIRQILLRTVDHEVGLTQWYNQLKPRQQLLTVALNFFDGLFDDQLFASLDQLVTNVWRYRDPLLVSFDYYDLEDVKSIFNFVPAGGGRVKVENRSPERRLALLKMAWQSHRRYILVTLSQLAKIVKDSAPNRSANLELYGSEFKQEHIRTVIGSTLSDLGLISIDAIEQTLLHLAADDHQYVQIVAAEAMARWRIFNRDKDLFDTLERWQNEAKFWEIVDLIVEEREENRYDGYAHIRATVALTVAFAASYDRPNQLSEVLHGLVKTLAYDSNRLVRQRFLVYTLPMVVGQHWQQLEKTLRDFAIRADLIPSIGVSLARAYRSDPDGIVGLLDDWQERADKLKAQSKNMKPRHREGILATVALTYGYLPYYAQIGPLTAEIAFQKLQRILANEREHPFVRIAVIRSISLMAQRRFADIEPYLRNIVVNIQPEEQEQVVDIIKDLFVKQRAKLKDGERNITIQGKKYPVWIKGETPLTEVEQAMLNWVNQADNQKAQEIGLQAYIAFAKVLNLNLWYEIEKIKYSSGIEEKKTQTEVQNVAEQITTNLNRSLNKSSWFNHLIAWTVTIGATGNLREIIKGLLPEALARYREEKTQLEFVIDSWHETKNYSDIRIVASRLKQALMLINSRVIKVGLVVFSLLFLCTLCNLIFS